MTRRAAPVRQIIDSWTPIPSTA